MPGVISKQTRVRPLAIPSPLVGELRRQPTLHHIDNVLAQDREEFKTVEIAAGGDVQALGRSVRRDDEVGAGGEGVPVDDVFSLYWIKMFKWECIGETHQQMRCFSMFQLAPFLP
jgi:hypothetical protein